MAVLLQVMLLQLLLVGSSVLAPQELSGKSKDDLLWVERDTGAKCVDYKELGCTRLHYYGHYDQPMCLSDKGKDGRTALEACPASCNCSFVAHKAMLASGPATLAFGPAREESNIGDIGVIGDIDNETLRGMCKELTRAARTQPTQPVVQPCRSDGSAIAQLGKKYSGIPNSRVPYVELSRAVISDLRHYGFDVEAIRGARQASPQPMPPDNPRTAPVVPAGYM
jgi:hypothetical protein